MKRIITSMLLVIGLVCWFKCRSLYNRDLNFIYKTILENHPGPYNEQDPDFKNNLIKNYNFANLKINRSWSNCEKRAAVSAFASSFNDSHLFVRWNCAQSSGKESKGIDALSLLSLGGGIFWVPLPTFNFQNSEAESFDQLILELSELHSCTNIVFDLRGNGGGNSQYGSKVVDALFGKKYADNKRDFYYQKVVVNWRASMGNLKHIASLMKKYPSQCQLLRTVEKGLKESLEQGKDYYKEFRSDLSDAGGKLKIEALVETKVIIIIDSTNVSAALDFIDEVKMMTKNVVLVGQTTNADRNYMEVRFVQLPSALGALYFPIKVYFNRPRLDNQPYLPDVKYQNVANTTELQNFIVMQIREGKLFG